MCHPLQRLPAQIWSDIADNLPSSDLISFSNAFQFFFDITKVKRTSFLLPAVLHLLAEHVKKRSTEYYPRKQEHLLMSLSMKDLLNIRLGCRRWDDAVRNYYTKQIYRIPHHFIDEGVGQTYNLHMSREHPRKPICFHGPTFSPNFDEWMNTIRLSHPPESGANPIFSSNLSFYCDNAFENMAAGMLKRQLVQNWGTHLLNLKIYIKYSPGELVNQYLWLRELLSSTPNVEYLAVIYEDYLLAPYPFPSRDLAELNESTGANPMPEMGRLTTLRLEGVPSSLQNAILQKAGQIQTLSLTPNFREYQCYMPVTLPHLKRLKVKLDPRSDCLQAMRRLITPSWFQNLHTLKLYIPDDGSRWPWPDVNVGVEFSPFKEVVTFLNEGFRNSTQLRYLHLVLLYQYSRTYSPKFLKDCETCRLHLPHVEELKLQVQDRIVLDFILPMAPSLKKLAIETLRGYSGPYPINEQLPSMYDVKEALTWNGWLERWLLHSNIWFTFPQLKFIRIQSEMKMGWTYRRRGDGTPVYIQKDGTEDDGGVRATVARNLNNLLATVF